MSEKKSVLFLCTGNSCRSQMAEGFLRALGGDKYEAFSAGTHPAPHVHPLAVKTMAERGIDISGQEPKDLSVFDDRQFDLLITVCDGARQECPAYFGAAQRAHWSLQDPALAEGSEEERMAVFRAIRDEIERRVRALVQSGVAEDDSAVP